MSQTILEIAKELVLAQVQAQQVKPEALHGVLHSTYETLRSLEAGGNSHGDAAAERPEPQVQVDWKGSISKHSIRCLECGDTFKQLSLRHLRIHDLDPRSYRTKYNIPRSQAFSARDATARRRELAQQIRPWELAPLHQQGETEAEAKPAAKTGAAKAPAKAAALSLRRLAAGARGQSRRGRAASGGLIMTG